MPDGCRACRDTFTVDVSRETLNCTEVWSDRRTGESGEALRLRQAGRAFGQRPCRWCGNVVEFTDLGESWKLVILRRSPGKIHRDQGIDHHQRGQPDHQSGEDKPELGSEFSVNLIPHTLLMTNLKNLSEGSRVNLEVDLIARYVERMMRAEKE